MNRIRIPLRSLFYFILVGILTNSAGFCVFVCLTWMGMGHKLAMSLLYLFSTGLGYWANKKLTFSHKKGNSGVIFRYFLVYLSSYVLNLALLLFFVDFIGFSYYAIQAIAIMVVAGLVFVSLKFFVFLEREGSS